MAEAIIEAQNIFKDYGPVRALHGVSLDVGTGEFIALVGPSGCGKTTLLKILAGFEEATDGYLGIEGKDMAGVPAARRPTRMVFQKLALFPHKTVADNIGFSLRIAGVPKAEIAARAEAMIDLMRLKREYLTRYPAQLSGGEQQRVALARALVSHPGVLLLDEPMSALDAKLKKSLQAELKKLHRELGTSFVLVTHDLEEAMMLADRICVMRAGHIVQVGTPTDIYYRPVDRFVASFIGETNFLPVTVTPVEGAYEVVCAAATGAPAHLPRSAASGWPDGPALMLARPEALHFVEAPAADEWVLSGRVDELFVKGATTQYRIRVSGLDDPLVVEVQGAATVPLTVGAEATLAFRPQGGFLLTE